MPITLSISATCIRLLATEGRRVKGWGDAPLSPGLVRDGLILDPKGVGKSINGLFESTKISKERVIISVTGLSFTYRILSLPRMKRSLLEEAILRGARKEIPLPLEELYLSWRAIGGGPDELDFFVLGVPRNLVDAVVQTLAEAGVKPYVMDLKPLALARAANREDALIVALEPDCLDVIVVANGIPAVMHTVTPREGASIEDNIRRLTDELSRIVSFHDSSHPEDPVNPNTPLLLTGELSGDATAELIKSEIEYPVEFLVPPLEFPAELPVTAYTTNTGLALKEVSRRTASEGDTAGYHDINLNILSEKHRTTGGPVSLRRILMPLALAIAIGLLFPVYQLKSEADAEVVHLQNELSRVSEELHQVHLTSVEAGQIEDTIDEISAETDTLRQEHQHILSGNGYFADTLRLVAEALPSEVYFTLIEVGADQIVVEGRAENPLAVINYVTTLETEGVFSEVRIAEIDEVRKSEAEEVETVAGAIEAEPRGVSFRVAISR